MKQAINIRFDGPPSPPTGRFVEAELDNGTGLNVGEWIEEKGGHWLLRITDLPGDDRDVTIAEFKLVLKQILESLPDSKDWLNPELEIMAKLMVAD